VGAEGAGAGTGDAGTAPGNGAPGATGVAAAPTGVAVPAGNVGAGSTRDGPMPGWPGGATARSIGDEGMAAPGIQRNTRQAAYAREA